MQGDFFKWFCQNFDLQLPQFSSFEEGLDYVLPFIEYLGEDLAEQKYYVTKKWSLFYPNVNGDDVLYVFKPAVTPAKAATENELWVVTNGNVTTGNWARMKENRLMIKKGTPELFDLAFMNTYIFIYKKQGQHELRGSRPYTVLVNEAILKKLVVATGENFGWQGIIRVLYYGYYYQSVFIPALILSAPLLVFALYVLVFQLVPKGQ